MKIEKMGQVLTRPDPNLNFNWDGEMKRIITAIITLSITLFLVIPCESAIKSPPSETNKSVMISDDVFRKSVSNWFGNLSKENYTKKSLYSLKIKQNASDPTVDFRMDVSGNAYCLYNSGKVEVFNNNGKLDKTLQFNKQNNSNYKIKIDNNGNVLFYPSLGIVPMQRYDYKSKNITTINIKLTGEPEINDGTIYLRNNGKIIYSEKKRNEKISDKSINNFKKDIDKKNNRINLTYGETNQIGLPINIGNFNFVDVLAKDDLENVYVQYSTWPQLISGNKYTGEYEAVKDKMIKVNNKGELLAVFDFISSDIDPHTGNIFSISGDEQDTEIEQWIVK